MKLAGISYKKYIKHSNKELRQINKIMKEKIKAEPRKIICRKKQSRVQNSCNKWLQRTRNIITRRCLDGYNRITEEVILYGIIFMESYIL